jgi:glycosyltransferase involved in cell wall biosynthesis
VHVAICCITFRRPDGLSRLLDGLNELTFHKNPEPDISVVVIDNDGAAPMRAQIEARRAGFRWQLRYGCEPVRGVSSARNRALDLVPPDAACIASIDDDEVPVPGWLDELLYVRRTYRAAIVQGPVRPHFLSPPRSSGDCGCASIRASIAPAGKTSASSAARSRQVMALSPPRTRWCTNGSRRAEPRFLICCGAGFAWARRSP